MISLRTSLQKISGSSHDASSYYCINYLNMVQLLLLLQFYFYVFCTIIFTCSAEQNYDSSPTKKFGELLALRTEFSDGMMLQLTSSVSETSKFRKMSTNTKQWVNGKTYSAINCPSKNLQAYVSFSIGYCVQNGTSSSITSASSLSNGNYNITMSVYSNSLCSGTPSTTMTKTLKQNSCPNSGNSSSEYYSITNSIPPLPAGLLSRYVRIYIIIIK